jgi:hypothetical protein
VTAAADGDRAGSTEGEAVGPGLFGDELSKSELSALRRLGRRALMDTSIVYTAVHYKSKNAARRKICPRGGECRNRNVE